MRTNFLAMILVVVISSGCSPSLKFSDNQRFVMPTNPEIHRQTRNTETNNLNSYEIGSGDVLSILVYNHPELTQEIMVPPSGQITFPFIEDLKIVGLSIPAVRKRIQEALGAGFVPNAQVAVNVKSIAGKKIRILGEVKNPKVLHEKDYITAVDAISNAGGFTLDAKLSQVTLIRRLQGNKSTLDILNLEKFFSGEDWTQNVELKQDDILYIPSTVIADISRFMQHIGQIIYPIMPNLMEGVILIPSVGRAFRGGIEVRIVE